MKKICVFTGAASGINPFYKDAAYQMGQMIGSRGLGLVYGGGKCGLMGKLSAEVAKNKGKIKGISLPMFDDIGVTPSYLDELEIQDNFYIRKKSLIDP